MVTPFLYSFESVIAASKHLPYRDRSEGFSFFLGAVSQPAGTTVAFALTPSGRSMLR